MFIVQVSVGSEDAATTRTVASRSEALRIAQGWKTSADVEMRIIGDGRIYSLDEFALTIATAPS